MAVIETSTPVHVDDEWRRWIAENLLLDSRPQDVYDELLRAGISSEEAAQELQQAVSSPYIVGASV